MTAYPIRIEGKMNNAWTNLKISFTLLHITFHQAPDCSLQHPSLLQAPVSRPNTFYICSDVFDSESTLINITLFNRFVNFLTLLYYHPHCNMKNLKLRQIKGLHKVVQKFIKKLLYPLSSILFRSRPRPNPRTSRHRPHTLIFHNLKPLQPDKN